MVVPRNRFFSRVTSDEASAMVGAVVDAWRMWVGWDNGLLKTGHDGWCCRWGRRVMWGDGGSRGRTCEWQRRSLMDGGLIIVAMRLIASVVEACCCVFALQSTARYVRAPALDLFLAAIKALIFTLHSPFGLLVLAWVILNPSLQ